MSPTETERDLDEYSDYNDNEDFDGHDDFQRENADKVLPDVIKTDDVLYDLNDDHTFEKDDSKTNVTKDTFETNDSSKHNSVASKSDNGNLNVQENHLEASRCYKKTEEDIISEILEDKLPSDIENKSVSEIVTDPLSDFADVDLS